MMGSRWLVLKLMSIMILISASVVAVIMLVTPPLTRQPPLGQSSDSAWTVADVTILAGWGVAPRHYGGPNFILSPDASRLAWINRQYAVCQTALPSKITICHFPPIYDEIRSIWSWSSDSHHLLLGYGINVNYMFNATSGEVRLVTDEVRSTPITWNASNDAAVQYLRSVQGEGTPDENIKMSWMHRVSATSYEEERFDFTTIFKTPIFFTKFVAVSADDTRFVVLLRTSPSPELTEGLWVVDLAAQQAKLLASYDDFEAGLMPENLSAFGQGIGEMRWDQERNRLLVTISSNVAPDPILSVWSIDLESGERSPLFTTLGIIMLGIKGYRYHIIPENSYFTPDGGFLIYDNEHTIWSNGWKSIFAMPLDSPNREPILVTTYKPCLPGTALITLRQTGGDERRYIYQPMNSC